MSALRVGPRYAVAWLLGLMLRPLPMPPGSLCGCGHPRLNHADCGTGPCRTNVSLALWRDSNDRKVTSCRCRSFYAPVETQEVK